MHNPRILVVARDPAFVGMVRDVLAAQLREATCESLDETSLRSRPNGAGVVLDGRSEPEQAHTLARRLRAMGFVGGIAIVGTVGDGARSEMGIVAVTPARIAHDLVNAVITALEQAEPPLADAVMRARRLVAAGEIALHLQHDINNPLAGLLAELQLMQLDPLPPEHAEAVDRMLTLCRRLMLITRSLDGVGERKS